jgi:hypothetical protein
MTAETAASSAAAIDVDGADNNVSANASPIYTLFDVESTDALSREHILRLYAGVLGAVRVRGFSSTETCAEIMRALADSPPLGTYDEQLIYPPIAKLGPAVYDFYVGRGLGEEYWVRAAEAVEIRRTLLHGSDPMDVALARLRDAWGGEVDYAPSHGRPMFAGMIREIGNGAKLHFDEVTRESPGLLDATPASFLTLNWYLSMPEQGGEVSVYRHRWRPADERFRDSYGYRLDAVADEPVAVVRPEAGDAVLFDSRNLHAIAPIGGAGRRVSLSFFLGATGLGPLHLWS